MLIISAYLFIGAVAGVLAGLLGIGGGVIVVPALTWLLPYISVPEPLVLRVAIATSLATVVMTSLSALRTHHQLDNIDWPVVVRIVPGLVLGAVISVWLSGKLPITMLQLSLGVFLLIIAAKLGLPMPRLRGFLAKPTAWLKQVCHRPGGILGVGVLVGCLSVMLGIGGGILTAPLLGYYGLSMVRSVATSSVCSLSMALVGTLGFAWTGWSQPALSGHFIGFIYWPGFVGIVLASMFFANVGARLTSRLSSDRLRRLFALFLVFVGIEMLVSLK